MASELEKQLGFVDLLVNNAGVLTRFGPLWVTDPDEWWKGIEVNLRGLYLCSHAILPGMVAHRRGRIIITASGTGLGPYPNASAYAISKCAAIRFSENLAVETAEFGISVFSFSPGFVITELAKTAAEWPEDEKWMGGSGRRMLTAGHDVPPERAAELVMFLASGQADALSGCYFNIRDDLEEMVQRAEAIKQKQLYTLRLRT